MYVGAGVKTPVCQLAGYLSTQVSLSTMVRFAALAGLILYAGVYWLDDLWQLFMLQLPNAIFIGVLAGLGVSVVQRLMPGRSGCASGLYTNTINLRNLVSRFYASFIADLL